MMKLGRIVGGACFSAMGAVALSYTLSAAAGTVVEVDHPTRGKYLSVGNPIKLSDSPAEVRRSPLLGEHTDEILADVLGCSDEEVRQLKASGALGDVDTRAAAE